MRPGFATAVVVTTAAAATVLVSVVAAPPASAAVGDAHLIATTDNGGLFQLTRTAAGVFGNATNVEARAGEIGQPGDAATVVIAGQLHALAPSSGTLFHALRRTDGNWTGLSSVENQAGDIGFVSNVAAANVAGSLHVLARVGDTVFHTVRAPNGSWTRFVNVDAAAGDPGNVRDVGAAGFANGQLQAVVATTGGGVFHAVRAANGTWGAFADVKALTGTNPGAVDRVAGATVGTAFHLLLSTSVGGLFHAVRSSGGSWTRLGNVKGQTGDPGPVLDVAATGFAAGGELQIAVTTFQTGALFHAIRRANGTWTGIARVPTLPGGDPAVESVSITGE